MSYVIMIFEADDTTSIEAIHGKVLYKQVFDYLYLPAMVRKINGEDKLPGLPQDLYPKLAPGEPYRVTCGLNPTAVSGVDE
jgi:hypothetical protein